MSPAPVRMVAMPRIRLLILGVAVGLVIMGGVAAAVRVLAPPTFHGLVLDAASPIREFELVTAGDRRVRLSDFRGKVVLLFFGYRFCPDVCPVSLTEMKRTLAALGAEADQVQVIMVSVDPERDTPDIIAEHVRRFDPRFLGLSGTPDEVAAAATPFGIFYEQVAGSAATQYLVNHTATITALDQDGRVRVVYPHGTAGEDIAADIRNMLAGRFLVLNGDVLCDLDLSAEISQHERTGARATIALYPVDDPSAYGLVRRSEDGEVREFLEKPEPTEIDTDEINAGAYVLERDVLALVPPDTEVSIEREVFPRLVGEGLYGKRLEGYWIDIGTPDRYLQANWDILEGRVEALAGEALRAGEPLGGAGSTVDRTATLGPRAVLGAGCEVGAGASVQDSVLLDGCKVGEGAVLRGAVLSAGVEVAPGAEIHGEVIGEGESVGAPA